MPDRTPPKAGSLQPFLLRREERCQEGSFAAVGIEAYPSLKDHAAVILHPAELKYFLPLPAERRRASFLLGRYAAKRALQRHLNEDDFSRINISPSVFKYPVVCYPMDDPWQVSITHSDALACSLAFPMVHPMALDIETIDPSRVEVMASQCRESERNEVARLGLELPAICTLLWTAKEAVSKALRTGLTCPFEVFEVHSITKLGEREYGGLYQNLSQYKFHSWVANQFVLTIVLPRKTEIEFETGEPFFGLH